MKMYNCHTHIFNNDHVPPDFLPPLAEAELNLAKGKISSILIENFFHSISLDGVAGMIDRANQFADIGQKLKPEEKMIDEGLIPAYPAGTRFVALSVDMDFMGTKKQAKLPFEEQLKKLAELKANPKYRDQIYPFVCADPRRKNVFDIVKRCIEQDKFSGIKIYPPLGYYPFDDVLMEIYKYASDNGIPVMTHCSRGGIFYRGKISRVHPKTGKALEGNSNDKLSENFTDPKNYEYVLNDCPNLKLCFAHFGGQGEWMTYLKERTMPIDQKENLEEWETWPEVIKRFMTTLDPVNPTKLKYPNLFADISYTLYDVDHCLAQLKDFLSDSFLKSRILYGSDFYMVQAETSESQFYSNFHNSLKDENLFNQIALTNVERYLNNLKNQVAPWPADTNA